METHSFAYLDDIIVIGSTLEKHVTHLREVFRRFRMAHPRLNRGKFHFFQRRITYLGHVDDESEGAPPMPRGRLVVSSLRPNLRGRRETHDVPAEGEPQMGVGSRTGAGVRGAKNAADEGTHPGMSKVRGEVRAADRRVRLWDRGYADPDHRGPAVV